jgi:hypothetical protein
MNKSFRSGFRDGKSRSDREGFRLKFDFMNISSYISFDPPHFPFHRRKPMSPEVFADLFRQGAFISALIAGFTFAFLGVLLTASDRKPVAAWAAGFAIAATAGLVVCALGWTLSVPRVSIPSPSAAGPGGLPESLGSLHRVLSLTFIACFFLFLTCLGLSGWIRSKKLGIVSTALAAFAACFAGWVMHFFVS